MVARQVSFPICLFPFISLAWGDKSNKILLQAMPQILLPIFSSVIFMVLGLTFKSFIHFECILVCGIRRWSSFIFLHISVQFSQHHWIKYLQPILCVCCLCQILIVHTGMGLFLGFLFCSIDLCVCFYATTMLFGLLQPCSID